MMRISLAGFAMLFALQTTFAQDFQKKYDLSSGGQILIRNFLGNVKVEGYTGSGIEIKAYKKGPDRDLIQINDLSNNNRVELLSRFPPFYKGASTVDFEVRVPRSIEYNFTRLSSFGGNVEVSHVIGRLRAESVRGNVEVKDVRGSVSASSISGNVSGEISRIQEPGNMTFRSISGNVEVAAPSNLDALVEMSTASGMLKTDFAIDVQERRYGPGREARGRLGSGKLLLWINSQSGRVSLVQKRDSNHG